MAAVETLRLHIRGKGGHGALPHRDRDPIVAAASVIMNLQPLVSRETDPLAAAVVSFGTITGGTANNVIPDTVELTGTVRSFSPEVRAALAEGIRRVAGHTTAALDAPAT
jgi:metal-dependent amidase/aminoacylase/carboxypeptidase family protein